MKNFDEKLLTMEEVIQNVYVALGQEDEKVTKNAMNDFGVALAEQAKTTAKDQATALYSAIRDEQIMVTRGARRAITSSEMKFFNEAVEKQTVTGLD